jgi:ribosome-associated protein
MKEKKSTPKSSVKKATVKKVAVKKVAPAKVVKAAVKKAAPAKAVKAPAKKVAPAKAVKAPAKKVAPAKAVKAPAKKVAPAKAVKAPAKKVAPAKAVKAPAKKVAPAKAVKAPVKVEKTFSEAVSIAATSLFELRAEKVQLIDLRGVNDVADYYIVATCTSEAQMQAILNELTKEFKAKNIQTKGIEYKSGVQWAVFDAGFELMVHLFEETKREEIQMDRLYSDAAIETLEEKDFIKETTKNKAITEDDLI